jgi:hypothetical protein
MQSSIIHIQRRAQQYPSEGIGMTNKVFHLICGKLDAAGECGGIVAGRSNAAVLAVSKWDSALNMTFSSIQTGLN